VAKGLLREAASTSSSSQDLYGNYNALGRVEA
jgi:hypothetical protein